MSNKVRTNIYIDEQIKREAKKLFEKYNISLSDAINIFLSQSVHEQGLPFEMKIPNKETKRVLKDIEEGRNIEEITLNEFEAPHVSNVTH